MLNLFFRFQSSALAQPSESCFQGQKCPHAIFYNLLHTKGHCNVHSNDSAVFSILQILKGMTESITWPGTLFEQVILTDNLYRLKSLSLT